MRNFVYLMNLRMGVRVEVATMRHSVDLVDLRMAVGVILTTMGDMRLVTVSSMHTNKRLYVYLPLSVEFADTGL